MWCEINGDRRNAVPEDNIFAVTMVLFAIEIEV
jgi:hypothetical protein